MDTISKMLLIPLFKIKNLFETFLLSYKQITHFKQEIIRKRIKTLWREKKIFYPYDGKYKKNTLKLIIFTL